MRKNKKSSKVGSDAKRTGLRAEAFLKQQSAARVQREVETLRLERWLREEAAKHAGIHAEPVPPSIVKRLASRAAQPPLRPELPPAPSTCLFPPWPLPPIPTTPPDITPPFVLPWPPRKEWIPSLPGVIARPHQGWSSVTTFTLEEAVFRLWNVVSAEAGTTVDKSAYGDAGTASLGGPDFSTATFGFESSFLVPDPGERSKSRVTIESCVNAHFYWLEALSFDAFSWGEVEAYSQLSVVVGSEPYSSAEVRLLYGESPRGNSGDPGIWNPFGLASSAPHSMTLTTTGQKTVSVSELVTFTARRHGNPENCDAVIEGICTWNPVFVCIEAYLAYPYPHPDH